MADGDDEFVVSGEVAAVRPRDPDDLPTVVSVVSELVQSPPDVSGQLVTAPIGDPALLPAVALFGPTRFTAIVAALIYAVPPVIRLVEVGLRTVPATPREAAIAAGATKGQLLYKVELPLARPALLVAANQ